MTDPTNLRERLVARQFVTFGPPGFIGAGASKSTLINPDGPEALAEIDRLQAEVVGKDKVIEELLAAVSWIEQPFLPPGAPEAELWKRVLLCRSDIKAALNQRPKG